MSVSVYSPQLLDQVSQNGVQHIELLPANNDEHGGVIVDLKEPMDPDVFVSMLRASVSQWRIQGKRGVWIKLPIELANLVESAVRLLVVQEKSGKLRGTGIWKIPTGVVEEGEDIFMAAVREVKEETGIDTEFLEIQAFRQSHKVFFGKSDLFFVCTLHPLSSEIQKQDLEIEAAKWMPFEEYAAQPVAQKHDLFKYISEICLAKLKRGYAGLSPVPLRSVFTDQLSYFYLNGHELNSPN